MSFGDTGFRQKGTRLCLISRIKTFFLSLLGPGVFLLLLLLPTCRGHFLCLLYRIFGPVSPVEAEVVHGELSGML